MLGKMWWRAYAERMDKGMGAYTSGQTVGEKLLFKDRVTVIHSVLGEQTANKRMSPPPSQLSLLL